jgi:8-amino-7-oxononanoate synthase
MVLSRRDDAACAPGQHLDWLRDELAELTQSDLLRRRRTFAKSQSVELQLDGQTRINFGSNDYLSLAGHPALRAAAHRALDEQGVGAGASPLLAGRADLQRQLERRLAQFEEAEAALLFTSGYAANVGAITSLVGRGDAVYSDSHNHASIIDGCRLSRAQVFVYPHNDLDALEQSLEQGGGFRRKLIVSDSLFSMDGDFAPLETLLPLAQRYGAMTMLDEAHATGVVGPGGRGYAAACGLLQQVDVRVGTLSKALGASGGFVAGRRELIDWLVNRARTYIFSTAAPPSIAAATLAALDLLDHDPTRGPTVQDKAQALRQRLEAAGWNVGASRSHIIPLILGDARRTLDLSDQLWQADMYVPAIRPPSVAAGQSRLRISVCYGHTLEMLDSLASALGA